MSDREKVFEAFRNCITEPKCRDCPWEQCEQFNQKKVEIPVTLALDVINLLKEQEHKDRMFHALEDDWKRLKELLKEQKTANLYRCPNCGTWVSAENVVRCKDCKHWKLTSCPVTEHKLGYMPPDWFCADGEKKVK